VIPQPDLAQLDQFMTELPEEAPCCCRCGERLRGIMDLAAGKCGLCADDELNEKAKDKQRYIAALANSVGQINPDTGKARF
jgi:transposase